jgi:hypothetical protein
MIVLAGTVFGHTGHNFGRHILHVFEDQIGDMPLGAVGVASLFRELVKPCFKRKPFGSSLLSTQRPVLLKALSPA